MSGAGLSLPLPFPVLPPDLVPDHMKLRDQVCGDLIDEMGARLGRIDSLGHELAAAECESLCALFTEAHAKIFAQIFNGDQDFPATSHLGRYVAGQEEGKADHAEHDLYFRVVRVAGASGPLFLNSVCRAKFLFHAEMAAAYSGIALGRFSALGTGLANLLAHAAGVEMAPIDTASLPPPGMKEVNPGAIGQFQPVRRWIIGHQIFAALTQSSIYAMLTFEQAMQAGELRAAGEAISLAQDQLLATSAAFRFAADFPPEAYRDIIRPSMGPPFVRDGFSGLLSADHCHLIQLLSRIRPRMKEAEVLLPREHSGLTSSLRRVYDDHKLVCERFDGAEGPSLRGKTCSKLSGVELLERFKQSRLGLLQQIDSGKE